MSTQKKRSLYSFYNKPLVTTQKRLRHLKSIAARNTSFGRDILESSLYFSLHLSSVAEEFYHSELVPGSQNPTWKSFSLAEIPLEELDTTSKSFILKIFEQCGDTRHLRLEWVIHMSGLVCIGNKLEEGVVNFPLNTVVFGVHDCYFVAAPQNELPLKLKPENLEMEVPPDVSTHKSYTVQALSRIQTVLRVIKQYQATSARAHNDIIRIYQTAQQVNAKRKQKEQYEVQVTLLQSELTRQQKDLKVQQEKLEVLQAENTARELELTQKLQSFEDEKELIESKRAYYNLREDLLKIGTHTAMRRKQLVSELAMIYPIRQESNNIHTIANVELRQSEALQAQSEVSLEVALGYTCHLVSMMSQFLDLPLRYPMKHKGSKSVIYDHIITGIADKEREFPLYVKGKEQFQCDYAVFLLNKNIAQLRHYCGIGTKDLRQTLSNVRSVLYMKLGVKVDEPGLDSPITTKVKGKVSDQNRQLVNINQSEIKEIDPPQLNNVSSDSPSSESTNHVSSSLLSSNGLSSAPHSKETQKLGSKSKGSEGPSLPTSKPIPSISLHSETTADNAVSENTTDAAVQSTSVEAGSPDGLRLTHNDLRLAIQYQPDAASKGSFTSDSYMQLDDSEDDVGTFKMFVFDSRGDELQINEDVVSSNEASHVIVQEDDFDFTPTFDLRQIGP